MFCPKCGNQLPNEATCCTACGATLQKAAAPAPEPMPSMAAAGGPAPAPAPAPEPMFTPNQAQQAPAYAEQAAPATVFMLPTNRSMLKLVFLGLITLGIYNIVIMDQIVQDLNYTARRFDGRRTMSYAASRLLTPITLGIFHFVWYHGFSNRLGNTLRARGIAYKMSAVHFWLLMVVFGFTIICPLIYWHMVAKSANLINEDYNRKGM